VTKILFAPFSIIGGLIAGLLGRRVFARIWGLIDDEEPPEPGHRDVSWGKVLAAAALQAAVFAAARAAVDRGARQAFASLTGSWPGERVPEPE
jgi:uncharacterized protein DUF4235